MTQARGAASKATQLEDNTLPMSSRVQNALDLTLSPLPLPTVPLVMYVVLAAFAMFTMLVPFAALAPLVVHAQSRALARPGVAPPVLQASMRLPVCLHGGRGSSLGCRVISLRKNGKLKGLFNLYAEFLETLVS